MPDDLTVAVAQPPCVALDVAANAVAHAAAVRAARSRIVVFPELSLTGYELDAPLVAASDERLAPLVEACAATRTIALAGAPVDGPHIAMLRIDGDGVSVAYRKQHPGADESARFAPGPCPEVLVVDGWRLGLAICRDTGVAGHADATAALGIDGYLAGLTDHPADDAQQSERARRISTGHGIWVAFASFAGPTGSGYPATAGRSGIWAPDGSQVVRAGRNPGEIARAAFTAS